MGRSSSLRLFIAKHLVEFASSPTRENFPELGKLLSFQLTDNVLLQKNESVKKRKKEKKNQILLLCIGFHKVLVNRLTN